MTKAVLRSLAVAGVLCGATALAQREGLPLADAQALRLLTYKSPSVPTLATDGSAVVVFTIRADGRVADAVTLTASDREVADAAASAVLRWRFERDSTFGRGRDAELDKVLRREVVEFVFKRDKVTGMNHREGAKAWFPEDRSAAVRTIEAEELDAPLERRPPSAEQDGAGLPPDVSVAGSVRVSFLIDETGRVRVPFVETADAPELADAALALVVQWTYQPPLYDGRPALVEVRNTLTFRPRRPNP
jgi:TonB family protein